MVISYFKFLVSMFNRFLLKYKKCPKMGSKQLRKNRLILEEEVSILEQTISSESDNDITQKYEEKKSELETL